MKAGQAVAGEMIAVIKHPKSLRKDRLVVRDEIAHMHYSGGFDGERLLPLPSFRECASIHA